MWTHIRVTFTEAILCPVLVKLAERQGALTWRACMQLTSFIGPCWIGVWPSQSLWYTSEGAIIPVSLEGNYIWERWSDLPEVAGGKGGKWALVKQQTVQGMNQVHRGSLQLLCLDAHILKSKVGKLERERGEKSFALMQALCLHLAAESQPRSLFHLFWFARRR